MKIETFNGQTCVILGENEQINLCLSNKYKSISVQNDNDSLKIKSNASFIQNIEYGKVTQKLEIPQIMDAEDIRKMCDKWIVNFEKIYHLFKLFIIKNSTSDTNYKIELRFNRYNGEIKLDLVENGIVILQGVSTYMKEYREIYNYILANVFNFYLSNEYENQLVDFKRSDSIFAETRTRYLIPTQKNIFSLELSYDDCYNSLENKIRIFHNKNHSCYQLLENLKAKVTPQVISESLEEQFNDADRQVEYLSQMNIVDGPNLVRK